MNEKRGTGCDYDNGIYHLTKHFVTGIQIMIAAVKKTFEVMTSTISTRNWFFF